MVRFFLPLLRSTVVALALLSPLLGFALSVTSVSPQGEVGTARQLRLQFSAAVVAFGDPRLPDPAALECDGAIQGGQGRWASEREWVFDLKEPLGAGARCRIVLGREFKAGPEWTGPREFVFNVGAPSVLGSRPGSYEAIEERQQFLLSLSGPIDEASVTGKAWCEVEGLGERIPLQVQPASARDAATKALGIATRGALERGRRDQYLLLVACQRPLPPDAKLRLVWGRGIAAAANPMIVSRAEQRLEFRVRKPFTAEFSCERERAEAPCMPIRPFWLSFSEKIPRAIAMQIRLKPAGRGKDLAPVPDKGDAANPETERISFPTPLPENETFQIVLPAGIKDASGRALANATSFPLTVRTGIAPPIAKFAAAPFGIIEREADGPALVPLTLRHVQDDLRPGRSGGQMLVRRYASDAEILAAYAQLRDASRSEWESRKTPLLKMGPGVRRLDLPVLKGGDPRPFEVIGVPLTEPGYHMLELRSQRLGESLLDPAAPMYVRTGVLVTNLGLHFKLGRESSLIWVTTLDRGKPVALADVAVNDCRGKRLWSGRTDANGLARVDKALPAPQWDDKCPADAGLFVTARKADERGVADTAFLFSSWSRGIESWRFNQPIARGTTADARAHTVLDRSLLRAGETVAMKHFFRLETAQGLTLAPPARLPTRLKIVHEGSEQEFMLPLSWTGGGRFAATQWAIPPTAKLGVYRMELLAGDHVHVSGGFRVEEFRVPLVDVRLTAPKNVPAAPTELNLAAQLNYMAGGPMAQAALKVSALLRPRVGGFPGYEDFSFEPPRADGRAVAGDGDDIGEPADEAQRDAKLVVDKQAFTTNGQGAAEIRLKGLPKITRASELLTELSYTDPNGEVQTVSQLQPLWPARTMVGLRSASWASHGGALKLHAVVLDMAGKPVAGQKVVVRARHLQTLTTRKRMVGGFYAYDNQQESKDLGEFCSGTSDAQGRVSCEAALSQPGQVELIASSKDGDGHVSEAATSVWITRQGELWFAQDNDDRIDVLPEKRRYEPGETAKLQVRMPYREATALIAIEREGVLETRVQTLTGRDPTIELKIERDWSPNVYVSVLALRGRIRDVPWYSFFSWGWRQPINWWKEWRTSGDYQPPTAMVDLAKPSFKLGVAALEVGLARHQLQVTVTPDKPQYGVRQKVMARIKVTQDGKPVPDAELAFAAVDEGLLALRGNPSWELLPALIRSRPWGVETATAHSEIVGRRHYGRKAVAAGGGGGRATRELFDTLLLWQPQVKLDAKGEALVEVPLNDSLTSFRLVAVADAGAHRFGTGAATVRVAQDLQLLSGLPPLVREGDQYQAMLTLRNASDRAMKLRVGLAGTARADGEPGDIARSPLTLPTQDLTLAAGTARELAWPVTVPLGVFSIAWEAEVQEQGGAGNAARDRLKVTQFVQPAVPLRVLQSSLVQLESPQSLPIAAPADALPEQGVKRGGLQIGLQPKLGGALPGLRRFFETYPYSCLEQQSSKALGLHDDAAWQALMGRLPTYLDRDGLASYFPPRGDQAPSGSDRLTAYVLAAAHEAGRALPDAPRRQMLDGLAAFVEGKIERRFWAPRDDLDVRRIAALEALARYGRAGGRLLATVDAGRINGWPTAAVIDWLSLHRRLTDAPQREARIAEAQAQLRARINYAGSTLRFVNEENDAWWWLMDGADANAARLILAVLDDPAWKGELPRLLTGTLARQQRGAWQTTTANLWGVLALEKFAAQFESVRVAGRTLAHLGAQSQALDWARKPDGDTLRLAWPAQPTPLEIRQDGAGKPWLTVQSLAAIPLKAPLAAGYRVTRAVEPVEQKDKGRWSRGDVLRVRVEIEALADMSWVVVNDPVPGGATILGSGSARDSAIAQREERRDGAGRLAYEERGFEAWRAYYEYLPRGKHVIQYTVRLNNAGRFQLPPTRVEAMYAPDRFGEQPNPALEVAP